MTNVQLSLRPISPGIGGSSWLQRVPKDLKYRRLLLGLHNRFHVDFADFLQGSLVAINYFPGLEELSVYRLDTNQRTKLCSH